MNTSYYCQHVMLLIYRKNIELKSLARQLQCLVLINLPNIITISEAQ